MVCLLLPQGMAEIESTYASSVIKLLKSVSYTFHSNVLMQWLGSDPFEELGYVCISVAMTAIACLQIFEGYKLCGCPKSSGFIFKYHLLCFT